MTELQMPFDLAVRQGLVQVQRVTSDQVYAAARVLRRSLECPSPAARAALANLLESVVQANRLGARLPELVSLRFVEAVLSLAAASAEEGSPAVSGAGEPG